MKKLRRKTMFLGFSLIAVAVLAILFTMAIPIIDEDIWEDLILGRILTVDDLFNETEIIDFTSFDPQSFKFITIDLRDSAKSDIMIMVSPFYSSYVGFTTTLTIYTNTEDPPFTREIRANSLDSLTIRCSGGNDNIVTDNLGDGRAYQGRIIQTIEIDLAGGNDNVYAGRCVSDLKINTKDVLGSVGHHDYIVTGYGKDRINLDVTNREETFYDYQLYKTYVQAGPERDTIKTYGYPIVALGGDGRDVIRGSRYYDVLIGGPGIDSIIGNGGGDTIVW